MSNVLKCSTVETGEPILLRDSMKDALLGRSKGEQRMALLRQEQENRARIRLEYLCTKAKLMSTGEQSGRVQGQEEGARMIARAREENQALLQQAQARQAEALRAADEDCAGQAAEFAMMLCGKIFRKITEMTETAPPEEPADPVGGERAEEKTQTTGYAPDARTVYAEELPALDEVEIMQAAEQAFPQDDPAPRLRFEKLPDLPPRTLQKALKGARTQELAIALKGMDTAGCATMIGALPKRQQEMVRQEMEFLGHVPVEDTAKARTRIEKTAGRLLHAGGLEL